MSAKLQALLSYPTLITYGCRWFEVDGVYREDISDKLILEGCSVERDSRRRKPGTFTVRLRWTTEQGQPLDVDLLTRAVFQPYAQLVDPTNGAEYEWLLGRYLMESPDQVVRAPDDIEVQGYDLISVYDVDTLYTYALRSGAQIEEALLSLLTANELLIDPLVYDVGTMPSGRHESADHVWSMTENIKYLDIINDIMRMYGYDEVYTDRDGRVVSTELLSLFSRSPRVRFETDTKPRLDDGIATLPVGIESRAQRDQFEQPNYWLGISENPDGNNAPELGAGLYELEYELGGPTSVEHRGRRVTRKVTVDAANQNALIAVVEREAELDTAESLEVTFLIQPFPELWHEDGVVADIPEIGLFDVSSGGAKMYATKWELPFDGTLMKVYCDRLRDVTS